MRVTVIGTGYVGTVTGACLAYLGHRVTCVDTDAGKIAQLRRGEMPIYEPGLADLVWSNAQQGRLRFTTELAGPVPHAFSRPPACAGIRHRRSQRADVYGLRY